LNKKTDIAFGIHDTRELQNANKMAKPALALLQLLGENGVL
jgi:hypothetical protein